MAARTLLNGLFPDIDHKSAFSGNSCHCRIFRVGIYKAGSFLAGWIESGVCVGHFFTNSS
jgi:hypothetical protein